MHYHDLRDFLARLESRGELRRIAAEVSPRLEMTEICDRTLRAGGPALLFERPAGFDVPVLGNLFGTPERVALALGQSSVADLRDVRPAAGRPQGARVAARLQGRLREAAALSQGARHGNQPGRTPQVRREEGRSGEDMRTYRTSAGPVSERPYYTLREIEDICADELRRVELYPNSPEPIRIERFIEKRFGRLQGPDYLCSAHRPATSHRTSGGVSIKLKELQPCF